MRAPNNRKQSVDRSFHIRTWMCHACGVTHDRDVNAARNILSAGRSSPSIGGNESSTAVAEPSQTYSRREAGNSVLRLAA
ncbi:MAG TPA: zinc ribbon domain-containing protein [Steroidobacteraceae bacterium]|nr:zinc ribbon domain-containing protein [Steroidobacteraceae bacterium]